jgi:hypothetical protein
MAGAIAQLRVDLVANTAKFTKGLARAKKRLKGFGKAMLKSAKVAAKWGAVIVAAAVAVGVSMVKNVFKSVDALAKMSDELGISTESLIAFRRAAELTGTSNETISKGMERLARNIGDAQQGFGEAIRAFDQLGLSAKDLAGVPLDQAMKIVADKIKAIEDPTLRASAAYGVFGRKGQELMNFLLLGTEGLDSIAASTKKFGLSLSRVDAAKIEAANDAIGDAKLAIEGLATQVSVKLAPFVEAIAEGFIDWATGGEAVNTVAQRIDSTFRSMVRLIAKMVDFASGLKAVFLGVESVLLNSLALTAKLSPFSKEGDAEILGAAATDAGRRAQEAAFASASGAAGQAATKFLEAIDAKAQIAAESVASKVAEAVAAVDPASEQAAAIAAQTPTDTRRAFASITLPGGEVRARGEASTMTRSQELLQRMADGIDMLNSTREPIFLGGN